MILDSPASWQSTVAAVEGISRDGDARLHILLCLADRDTRNQRVRTRTAQRSQPVGVSTTDGNGSSRFQHLPADTLHVNAVGPLDAIVTDVLQRLGIEACKTHQEWQDITLHSS